MCVGEYVLSLETAVYVPGSGASTEASWNVELPLVITCAVRSVCGAVGCRRHTVECVS